MSITQELDEAIKEKLTKANQVLMERERNFRSNIEAHITYHEYLMRLANEQGDITKVASHRLMIDTYNQILKNHTLSNSYSKV